MTITEMEANLGLGEEPPLPPGVELLPVARAGLHSVALPVGQVLVAKLHSESLDQHTPDQATALALLFAGLSRQLRPGHRLGIDLVVPGDAGRQYLGLWLIASDSA